MSPDQGPLILACLVVRSFIADEKREADAAGEPTANPAMSWPQAAHDGAAHQAADHMDR
jgi:hypothetical protein